MKTEYEKMVEMFESLGLAYVPEDSSYVERNIKEILSDEKNELYQVQELVNLNPKKYISIGTTRFYFDGEGKCLGFLWRQFDGIKMHQNFITSERADTNKPEQPAWMLEHIKNRKNKFTVT